MSADQLTILRALDTAPVAPRHDLHDALLDRLLVELQAPPTWRDRLQLPRVRVRMQRVAIAAAAMMAVAAVAVTVGVVRDLLSAPRQPIIQQPPELAPSVPVTPTPPTGALGVVLDARGRWLGAPRPLHATTVTERIEQDGSRSTTHTEVWLRDEAEWRTTSTTDASDGSYTVTTVWDGGRELVLGDWIDAGPSAELTSYQTTGRHPFGTPLRDWVASTYTWERRCAEGELLADTEVAGRPVHHVRCGTEELWLDIETGLLVRHERPADVDDHDDAQQSFGVTAVTFDPELSADTFETLPPPDRQLSEFTALPTALQAGDKAPPFDARTADGERVDLSTLRGQHVLVVFWSPGLFDLGNVEQVHRAGREGLTILVHDDAVTRTAEDADYVAARGYTVPLVFDAAPPAGGGPGPIAQAWRWSGEAPPGGLHLAQLWVLVGPDGNVVDTWAGNLLPEELESWLDTWIPGR